MPVYDASVYDSQQKLWDTLAECFPDLVKEDTTKLQKLHEALVELVDAKCDDIYDRVKEQGDYRRDY